MAAGRQFAEHDGMTEHVNVSRDKYMNEIPAQGKFSGENTTPGEGAFHFNGNQYDDSVGRGGYGSYGVSVEDRGKTPVSERTTVNVGRYPTDRGREN